MAEVIAGIFLVTGFLLGWYIVVSFLVRNVFHLEVSAAGMVLITFAAILVAGGLIPNHHPPTRRTMLSTLLLAIAPASVGVYWLGRKLTVTLCNLVVRKKMAECRTRAEAAAQRGTVPRGMLVFGTIIQMEAAAYGILVMAMAFTVAFEVFKEEQMRGLMNHSLTVLLLLGLVPSILGRGLGNGKKLAIIGALAYLVSTVAVVSCGGHYALIAADLWSTWGFELSFTQLVTVTTLLVSGCIIGIRYWPRLSAWI